VRGEGYKIFQKTHPQKSYKRKSKKFGQILSPKTGFPPLLTTWPKSTSNQALLNFSKRTLFGYIYRRPIPQLSNRTLFYPKNRLTLAFYIVYNVREVGRKKIGWKEYVGRIW
jgi:hypothetical protein